MLVRTFEIEVGRPALVGPASAFQREHMGAAAVEPDVQNVGDHLEIVGVAVAEEGRRILRVPGVHALFAKNAIGAVLDADEYERIVNGETEDEETSVVPDDASSLIESDDDAGDDRVELGKDDAKDDAGAEAKAEESGKDDGEGRSRSDS